jgi:hypothetical protein
LIDLDSKEFGGESQCGFYMSLLGCNEDGGKKLKGFSLDAKPRNFIRFSRKNYRYVDQMCKSIINSRSKMRNLIYLRNHTIPAHPNLSIFVDFDLSTIDIFSTSQLLFFLRKRPCFAVTFNMDSEIPLSTLTRKKSEDNNTTSDIWGREDLHVSGTLCNDKCGIFLLFVLFVTGSALCFWIILGSIYTNVLRTSSALLCFGQLGSTWRYMGPVIIVLAIISLLWILRLFLAKASPISMQNCLHCVVIFIAILMFAICYVGYTMTETGMVIQYINNSMYRCEFGNGQMTASLVLAPTNDTNLSEPDVGCEFWSASAFCSEPFGYLATVFESRKINGTSGVYVCKSTSLDGLKLCLTYDNSLAISGWMNIAGIVFSLCLLVLYSLMVVRLNREFHECCPNRPDFGSYTPLRNSRNSPQHPGDSDQL